jgi:hypothetical protein
MRLGQISVALIVLASSSIAHASPQDLFGFGARTPGLAMTGTSYAEGYEAVYMNPAGLGATRRRGLFIGLHGAGYHLSIDGEEDPLEPARGMSIGFHLPIPFGDFLQDRLVLGGAFFTPAAALMIGRVAFPEAAQWTVLDRAQVLALQVALGIDLHGLVDGLQIGIGVSALANVIGELDVRLDETSAFSSVVETQLLTTFAPILGARYVQPEFGVGVAYRHELAAHMDLEIRTADLPIELPVIRVGGVVQYDPPTLLLEGYWRPIPDVMIVLNLTTRFWEAYPGAQISTTELGSNAPRPEFQTLPSPRVAVEGTWRDPNFTLTVRGGYAFEPTPARPARMAPRLSPMGAELEDQVVALRMIDNHRHVLTIGAGLVIHVGNGVDRLVLDLYGQLHALQPRTHVIGATEDSPAPMVTEGYILAAGWALGVEF